MTSDLWDGTPSPNVGSDNVFTNFQNPRPSATWFNYADWIISNYSGGKTSFTDSEFDVHNFTDTAAHITLKFNLDPTVSGDVASATKILSVPHLATEPPVPYQDEIVTCYATQTLYNKSFVGAVFRTHANVPPSPGANTGGGGIFYGLCVADDNYVVPSSGSGFAGCVLPYAGSINSTVTVVNTQAYTVNVVPFLGDTFAPANFEILVNNNAQVFPYTTSPFTPCRTTNNTLVQLSQYTIRTFICTQIGVWKDVSIRLNNAADFTEPSNIDNPSEGNILVRTRKGSGGNYGGNYTRSLWTINSIADPIITYGNGLRIYAPGASSVVGGGGAYAQFDTSMISAALTSTYKLPDISGTGNIDALVTNGSGATLSNKILDASCAVHMDSIKPQTHSPAPTAGQIPAVNSTADGFGFIDPPTQMPMFGPRYLGLSFELSTNPTVNATLNAINQYTVVTGGADNAIHLPTATAGDFVVLINNSGIGGVLILPAVGGGTNGTPLGDQGILLLMSINGTNWRVMDGT